jgi:hypothetical protein
MDLQICSFQILVCVSFNIFLAKSCLPQGKIESTDANKDATNNLQKQVHKTLWPVDHFHGEKH